MVALLTMTVSIVGSSNPTVAIPTLFRIASGVSLNHWSILFLSGCGVVPSKCSEKNPASRNFLLTSLL
jgi:hypothetical protein